MYMFGLKPTEWIEFILSQHGIQSRCLGLPRCRCRCRRIVAARECPCSAPPVRRRACSRARSRATASIRTPSRPAVAASLPRRRTCPSRPAAACVPPQLLVLPSRRAAARARALAPACCQLAAASGGRRNSAAPPHAGHVPLVDFAPALLRSGKPGAVLSKGGATWSRGELRFFYIWFGCLFAL